MTVATERRAASGRPQALAPATDEVTTILAPPAFFSSG